MRHLYSPHPIVPQSFANVKRCTVPKQSLSLREILKRYLRREPLPSTTDGIYEERFGDLEKLAKADIVDQMAKVEELKSTISRVRKKELDRLEKLKADGAAAAAAKSTPPTPTPTPPTQPVSG